MSVEFSGYWNGKILLFFKILQFLYLIYDVIGFQRLVILERWINNSLH